MRGVGLIKKIIKMEVYLLVEVEKTITEEFLGTIDFGAVRVKWGNKRIVLDTTGVPKLSEESGITSIKMNVWVDNDVYSKQDDEEGTVYTEELEEVPFGISGMELEIFSPIYEELECGTSLIVIKDGMTQSLNVSNG